MEGQREGGRGRREGAREREREGWRREEGVREGQREGGKERGRKGGKRGDMMYIHVESLMQVKANLMLPFAVSHRDWMEGGREGEREGGREEGREGEGGREGGQFWMEQTLQQLGLTQVLVSWVSWLVTAHDLSRLQVRAHAKAFIRVSYGH